MSGMVECRRASMMKKGWLAIVDRVVARIAVDDTDQLCMSGFVLQNVSSIPSEGNDVTGFVEWMDRVQVEHGIDFRGVVGQDAPDGRQDDRPQRAVSGLHGS